MRGEFCICVLLGGLRKAEKICFAYISKTTPKTYYMTYFIRELRPKIYK